jgi:hypothetical protein
MGLDLEPVSVMDTAQTAWLETLVWPGEENRLALLRQALDVARMDPPVIVRGDLRTDLPLLASQAPKYATLVVFHSAVLAYISSEQDRTQFAMNIAQVNAVWLANESPSVLPCKTAQLKEQCLPGEFLITRDGEAIACSDPHGKFLRWL